MKKLILVLAMLVGCAGSQDETQGVGSPVGSAVSAITCTGQLAGTALNATYIASAFSDGSVLATGTIVSGSAMGTDAVMYAPGDGWYPSAPVTFSMDVMGAQNGGYWAISANRVAMTVQVVYFDADANVVGKQYWDWTQSYCTSKTF